MKRTGVTLVELLIVVAIVALLTALLFPVFSHARSHTYQATCGSNLKQIGLAAMLYAQDYDGRVFPSLRYADDSGVITAWCDCQVNKPHPHADKSCGPLSTYIKNVGIWTCPAASDTAVTYGLNIAFVRAEIAGGSPVRLAQISSPSETILVADRVPIPPDDLGEGPYLCLPTDHQPVVQGRHSGLANVLWADGHLRAERPATREQSSTLSRGDILRSAPTGNPREEDYYYEVSKAIQ